MFSQLVFVLAIKSGAHTLNGRRQNDWPRLAKAMQKITTHKGAVRRNLQKKQKHNAACNTGCEVLVSSNSLEIT